MTSTLGGLAPWFGSKRTMAPTIVRAIGPHNCFWDIFSGSMAVLLAKPRTRTEVVNDLHGDLINLSRCLQHPKVGPALYRRLRRVLCSEAEFQAARSLVVGQPAPDSAAMPDIDRAFAYFVSSWQGMNGVAGMAKAAGKFARRFSSTGGDPATRWAAAVRSIPAWRRRLEGVTVLQSDAIELAGKIEDRDGTAVYSDSPYFSKSGKYLHDFTPDDHIRLAASLNRFSRTRVVVSYYHSPEIPDLYPAARWRCIEVKSGKSMSNCSTRDGESGPVPAPEILLINDALDTKNI